MAKTKRSRAARRQSCSPVVRSKYAVLKEMLGAKKATALIAKKYHFTKAQAKACAVSKRR